MKVTGFVHIIMVKKMPKLARLAEIIQNICWTNCGRTQQYIAAALSNNWSNAMLLERLHDELFRPCWVQHWNACNLNDPIQEHYFHPGWVSTSYSETAQGYKMTYLTDYPGGSNLSDGTKLVTIPDLIKVIERTALTCGYVNIRLWLWFSGNPRQRIPPSYYDHLFILCNTEEGLKIVDSYMNLRFPEIRNYDDTIFLSLLTSPSVSTWDSFCKGNISDECSINYGETLFIDFSAINASLS